MNLVWVRKPQPFVGPHQILDYFGLQPMNVEVPTLVSMQWVLQQYEKNPRKVTVKKGGDVLAFDPSRDIKWIQGDGVLSNPRFGTIMHAAEVFIRPNGQVQFNYDLGYRVNGERRGEIQYGIPQGSPSSQIVPILEIPGFEGSPLLAMRLQQRPGILNPETNKLGAIVATIAGGFGSVNGKAETELREELGITSSDLIPMGYFVADRAWTQTVDNMYMVKFTVPDIGVLQELSSEHEVFLGGPMVTPLKTFPAQIDPQVTIPTMMAKLLLKVF